MAKYHPLNTPHVEHNIILVQCWANFAGGPPELTLSARGPTLEVRI